MTILQVPVTWGAVRLRGKAEGALLDDSVAGNVQAVRALARSELLAAEVEASDAAINEVIVQLLRQYTLGHGEWAASRQAGDGVIGHVVDVRMPSDTIVRMADRRLFERFPSALGANHG